MNSKFTPFAVIALAVAVVAAVPSLAGIQGSKHDFTGAAWSGNEICAPCHIPHNASSEAALWARGSLSELGPYTLWSGEDVLGKRSLTCMSCHDGTLALGITSQKMGDLYPEADLGTDLTNDHPIGVAYTTSTAGTRWGVAVPSSSGTSAKIGGSSGLSVYASADGAFRVECSSCHSVHGTEYPAMLRMTNYGSALCLTCHIR